MSEVEHEPSPEQRERERLIWIIRKYLPEDEGYLLEMYPDPDDVEDLLMAIDGTLLGEGLDPDVILKESGEYLEVRYKPQEEPTAMDERKGVDDEI